MERGIAATIGTLIHRRASAAIYRYFYCTCRCGRLSVRFAAAQRLDAALVIDRPHTYIDIGDAAASHKIIIKN